MQHLITVARQEDRAFAVQLGGQTLSTHRFAYQAEAAQRRLQAIVAIVVAAAQTPVTMRPALCQDETDPICGQAIGTEFVAGDDEDATVIYLDGHVHGYTYPHIDVIVAGHDVFRIEQVEAALPALIALFVDPRLPEARAAFGDRVASRQRPEQRAA